MDGTSSSHLPGLPFDHTYILSYSVSSIISSIVFGDRFDYEDKELHSLLYLMLKSLRFTSTSWEQAGNCMTEFFKKSIVLTVVDMFFPGTETVGTTPSYSFLILLKYLEIEEKIHEEIDRVIGRNRIEDRSRMPYTDAVIHECQRLCDILPTGVSRRTTTHTQVRGYTIPQGTEVFALLGSALKDPEHFERPEAFDPGHFLDDKGQFKKNEAFMPFSIGKRYCFGEMLARMELFLFVTSILQRFRFESPVDRQDLDIAPKLVGFVSLPRSYQICLIPR